MYLKKRASQGFNVVQAVALAELDGLNDPNPNGDLPLINNDPAYPNDKYFNHIDFIIKEAEKLGIYIALLPTWGDKLNMKSWGTGPEIFNSSNAYDYGKWIGNRYRDYDNIIWIIGGDRQPREGSLDVEVWNQMANGVVDGAGGYDNTLMSYHPQPKDGGGSSTWFHQEKWLDFNMHQTGHCLKQTYKNIGHDYQLNPIKPVLDAEPLYEDHPNCFNAKELGYSVPEDIRRIINDLNKSPIKKDKRFIILDDIDRFNINSLNALLKIIEDPGKNNFFILINNKSNKLLNTIKSRSIEIKIMINNQDRLSISTSLLKYFNQDRIFDENLVSSTPGNFLKFNYIFNNNSLDINEKFLTNFSNILRIYKKEKDIFYKEMLLFFVEYNFQKLKSQEMLNNKKLIEKRLMILKNINDFFLYNLNQNTLLSNLEENYFDD